MGILSTLSLIRDLNHFIFIMLYFLLYGVLLLTITTPLIKLNYNRSFLTQRPVFSLFECYRQKIGLIFSKHNSVLGFPMGQNPYVQNLIRDYSLVKFLLYLRKEPRRQVNIYLQLVFLSPPSPVLANINSILAYDVPRTEDASLTPKFRFNVGPAHRSPLLV